MSTVQSANATLPTEARADSIMWRWDGAILFFRAGDKIRVFYKGEYHEGIFVAEEIDPGTFKIGIRYNGEIYRSPSKFCQAVGAGLNPRDHAEIWMLDEANGYTPAWFVRDNYTPNRKVTGRERHMHGVR